MTAKLRKEHRKRATREPIMGHVKHDQRMNRSFYKAMLGDNINIMLAAAGVNFKKVRNKWKSALWLYLQKNYQRYSIAFQNYFCTKKQTLEVLRYN